MLPSNLFIDSPEMEDSSLHQLSNDTDMWPEEVLTKLKERVPQSASLNSIVKFMKQDNENGVATGSISVHSADKVIVIPLIIKDFMLCPMDIMIHAGKLLPLTHDYFNGIFSSNKLFDKLEEFPTLGGLGRFDDTNLFNTIYPPSMGRHSYASAGYEILDQISDTFSAADLQTFKDTIYKNEKIAARLLSGPHADVIRKVANFQPVNSKEFRSGMDNLVYRPIAMLRKEGPNKYNLLANSDSVFHPSMTPLNRGECMELLAGVSADVEDSINEVDQNGEKMLQHPERNDDDIILAKPDQEIIEDANEYGHFSVKTKTGINVEGVVVPTMIDFDQNRVDLKLFLGKTMATVQQQISGVRVKDSRFEPKTCVPRVGQTGVFLYKPDQKHALATVPVTVQTIIQTPSEITLRVVDMLGVSFKIKLATKSAGIKRIAQVEPGTYLMPHQMKWVATEDFSEISNSPTDYVAKEASLRVGGLKAALISTGYDQYSLKGVEKYAQVMKWDPTNLERYQAKFLLTSLGASSVKVASAFKEASMRGRAEIQGLKNLPLASEKIATGTKVAKHLYEKVAHLKRNLIKEASYLENTQTVDALLSLNFVNPNNIAKFVGKIAGLKASVSAIASCLMASRLGVKEIPEQAAATAMNSLVEVISGLESLRAVNTTEGLQK